MTCAYCDGAAVSGLADVIEHNGLSFCSVGCLWDAAFCDGFDTALDKIRAQRFEPIDEVIGALELETINTAPRRDAAREARRGPAFHRHLDSCEQCRTRPFALCAVGSALLHASASQKGSSRP